MNTTSDSPSDGSTRPMWFRNAGLGPTTSTPWRSDPLPLGVEQVRDAVQRHHGLPGARAALDHQHPGVVEPDDLVLFGLDRRHDVAHPVTARRVDRREQRGVPGASLAPVGAAEDLVGEIDAR